MIYILVLVRTQSLFDGFGSSKEYLFNEFIIRSPIERFFFLSIHLQDCCDVLNSKASLVYIFFQALKKCTSITIHLTNML